MVVESVEQTNLWRLLWSHATRQVVATFPQLVEFQPTSVGYGIGLRDPRDPSRALILHPAGQGRDIGDLALTVVGKGTHVIPRYDRSYMAYLSDVGDAIDASVNAYLRA